jgi:membrane-associated phospholipid phosphatase
VKKIVVLLVLLTGSVRAQDSLSFTARIGRDGMSVLEDGGRFFASPLRGSSAEWLTAGLITGGIIVSATADNTVRSSVLRSHSTTGNNFASFGTEYGNAKYGLGLSGLLYLTGLCADRREIAETGMMLFESIAFAGITTTVLKSVIGRSRPFLEEGHGQFHPFQAHDEYLSFPSGHSTVAFAVSSVLSRRIDNLAVSVGLYSLAVITAWSRVYNDEHWLSDNIAGAVIGITAGYAVTGNRHRIGEEGAFRITPAWNGLRAELSF